MSQIWQCQRYEDDKNRIVNQRVDLVSGAIQFYGVAMVQFPNGQTGTLNFRIDAFDINDAYDKMDASAKVALEEELKKLEAAQRRQAILKDVTAFPPRKHLNGN